MLLIAKYFEEKKTAERKKIREMHKSKIEISFVR
jgi:hypothetical protein